MTHDLPESNAQPDAELDARIAPIAAAVDAALSSIGSAESPLAEHPPLDVGQLDKAQAAAIIDHTLLKPDATSQGIRQLCAEAASYGFASVCVNAGWLSLCRELLQESSVKLCPVIGFPLGATLAAAKAYEAAEAIRHGAQEVDMVIAIGPLKDGAYRAVYDDIAGVVGAAHPHAVPVKVIIETALLADEEKIAACLVAKAAGADFVKTSTGFSGGGATAADVALMRRVVGAALGVKASGGVRTAADLRQMVAAGATRIGASAGVRIVEDFSDGRPQTPSSETGETY